MFGRKYGTMAILCGTMIPRRSLGYSRQRRSSKRTSSLTLLYMAVPPTWNTTMPSDKHYVCPVCGYKRLTEPPRDSHGCASFEICPSCGTEFGNDDFTKNADELRLAWLRSGAPWWSKAIKPPKNWNPVMQLRESGMLEAVVPARQSA